MERAKRRENAQKSHTYTYASLRGGLVHQLYFANVTATCFPISGLKMGESLANGADQVEKDVFIALAKRFKSVNINKNAQK